MTTSPFIQNVVCRLFYNVSVQEAFKALIMRDYDTTNITLIRQLIKMVGSDYSSACRNRK